jgi:hypothetical protein
MNSFAFDFDRQELQTILNGLGELPAKLSLPLIQKIQIKIFESEGESNGTTITPENHGTQS